MNGMPDNQELKPLTDEELYALWSKGNGHSNVVTLRGLKNFYREITGMETTNNHIHKI